MESRTHHPPAFVFGMTVNGLSVLRSLGRRGVECYGLDSDDAKIGFFSRYCSRRVFLGDPLDDPEGVMAVVRRLVSQRDSRPVLFVTSDDYLDLFAGRYGEIEELFLHALPRPEVIELILDKRKLALAAERAGVPFPRTVGAGALDGPGPLAADFAFPVIIKPAASHLGRRNDLFRKCKAQLVPDRPSLEAALWAGREAGIELLVQEHVPGPDSEIYLFYAHYPVSGGPPTVFTKRKLRQYPVHLGYGCANESVREPEVVRLGRRLMGSLPYRGLGGVEFKRDSRDGIFRLIEVHGRTPMTGGLAAASGLDLPWIAYCDLTGEKTDIPAGFAEGVKWFRVRHDLAALRQYRREGSLSIASWLRSYRGRRVFSTFDRRDPFPLLKRLVWEGLGPVKKALLKRRSL